MGGRSTAPQPPRRSETPRLRRGVPRSCEMSRPRVARALLVDPDLLHAAPAVERVMRHEVLHVRPGREVIEPPPPGGPASRLLQLFLDGVHEGPPPGRIELL